MWDEKYSRLFNSKPLSIHAIWSKKIQHQIVSRTKSFDILIENYCVNVFWHRVQRRNVNHGIIYSVVAVAHFQNELNFAV